MGWHKPRNQRKQTYADTDERMDRQAYRQTGTWTDAWIHTDRHTDNRHDIPFTQTNAQKQHGQTKVDTSAHRPTLDTVRIAILHVMHSRPPCLGVGCRSLLQIVHVPLVTHLEELIANRRAPFVGLRPHDAPGLRDTSESAPVADAASTTLNVSAGASVSARPLATHSGARYTETQTNPRYEYNCECKTLGNTQLKSLRSMQQPSREIQRMMRMTTVRRRKRRRGRMFHRTCAGVRQSDERTDLRTDGPRQHKTDEQTTNQSAMHTEPTNQTSRQTIRQADETSQDRQED